MERDIRIKKAIKPFERVKGRQRIGIIRRKDKNLSNRGKGKSLLRANLEKFAKFGVLWDPNIAIKACASKIEGGIKGFFEMGKVLI